MTTSTTTTTTRTGIRAVSPDAVARLCRAEGLGDEDDDVQDLETRIGKLLPVAILQVFVSRELDGAIYELADGRWIASFADDRDDIECESIDIALAVFDPTPVNVHGVLWARAEFILTWVKARDINTHYPIG